jgi:hypothetical protein
VQQEQQQLRPETLAGGLERSDKNKRLAHLESEETL